VALVEAESNSGTIYYDPKTKAYSYKQGVTDAAGVAWGSYKDTVNTTGWGALEIRTNGSYVDSVQLYGAGYLEGSLTALPIWQAHNNMIDAVSDDVANFLITNDKWARSQADTYGSTDSFWRQAGLVYNQFDGQMDGYNAQAASIGKSKLSLLDFLLLSSVTDLGNIEQHFQPLNYSNLSDKEFDDLIDRSDHCSVLLKLLPDYDELYFGHTTWTQYRWMLRIYKTYYFDYQDTAVKAKGVIFSGYPGVMFSIDDYYLTTANLAITETTNNIFNNSEYALISPETLMTWVRVRVANALSSTGKEWTTNVGKYISGTYPNQWIVLDYKLFTPNQPLLPNTLWVLEEIVSRATSADVTQYLERGDWRSYNVPFFLDIYNISMYPQTVTAQGTDQSYDLAPRAKIFRRDVGNVVDMESFQYLMRYNNYQQDPYSEGSAKRVIASRGDLDTQNPVATGAIDAKVINSQLMKNYTTIAIGTPTYQGQPPFVWSESAFASYPHVGQPDTFNFPWVEFSPSIFTPSSFSTSKHS